MGSALYRLMISSTTNEHLVSVLQIRCTDLFEAERRAITLLRARQLVSPEGKVWDRWDLGHKPVRTEGWVHAANGDVTGTVSTIRKATGQRRGHGFR